MNTRLLTAREKALGRRVPTNPFPLRGLVRPEGFGTWEAHARKIYAVGYYDVNNEHVSFEQCLRWAREQDVFDDAQAK